MKNPGLTTPCRALAAIFKAVQTEWVAAAEPADLRAA